MNKMLSRNYVNYAICLLFAWLVLTSINLNWMIDRSYLEWFNQNAAQNFLERMRTLDLTRDPAYFFTQASASGWISFPIFFGALIFICVVLKFSGLLQVTPRPGILDVAPYLLVLGFLHEGIQMRIAIALSIALWAIIYYAKNQRLLALFILGVACTFHISAAAFFLVFLLAYLFERFGKIIPLACVLLAVILAYTSFIPDLLIRIGVATNARFLLYSQGIVFERQNSTGLFQYFIFFVIFLTAFVWRFYKPSSTVWKNLYSLALVSGFLAIAILQVFRFNVVVSSRLADLLLLPVLLLVGATLSQLKEEKRYWLLIGMLFTLICYAAARGFVSFNPAPIRAFVG